MIMKRRLRSFMLFFLCCSLILTGCNNPFSSLLNSNIAVPVTQNKATLPRPARPEALGAGLVAESLPHFPEGFTSKYPLKGEGQGNGIWEGLAPIFDSLGGQNAYARVHSDYTSGTLTWTDKDYRLTSRSIGGDYWELDIKDLSYDDILHLERYALDLGAEVLTPPGEELAFVLRGEGHDWWGKVIPYNGSTYRIYLWRVMRVETGKPLVVTAETFAAIKGSHLYFASTHTEGKMQSLRVEAQDGYLDMSAQGGYSKGAYQRSVSYRATANSSYASSDGVFHFDDIPQEPGETLWSINTSSSAPIKSATLLFEDIADLAPVIYGEGFGALLVKGAPWGSVKALTDGSSNRLSYEARHTDYNGRVRVQGSQTADGDTLLWLPPGYWEINIQGYLANNVPVSEGQLTVLTAPTNLRRIDTEFGEMTSDIATEALVERGLIFLNPPIEQADGTVRLEFLLIESGSSDPHPQKENVAITENGLKAELLSLEKLDRPPNVVLLLDSSGSMEGQLEATIAAARTFIESLPDNAGVQLVDFDSTAVYLPGITKAEAMTNLNQITLGGSTALYDSTIMGLGLLQDKERPTLVLFTDGENEPAYGGLTDKQVVVDAITAAGIPIYTIGFGPAHAPLPVADPGAEPEYQPSDLRDFAMLSEGKYYSAADQEALRKVFDAIAARLGHAYAATYRRPQESSISDVPVVTVVVDASGSMNGRRMEILKSLYRQFIIDAPEGLMMQVMTLDSEFRQMLTTDKAAILQSLSNVSGAGGTPIYEAALTAFRGLMDVATSKRILIYSTDEAMSGFERNAAFVDLLHKYRNADISCLWVGVVENRDSYSSSYSKVAEESGGAYAIAADPAELLTELQKMLVLMNAPATSEKSAVGLTVTLAPEGAPRQAFSGNTEAVLKPLPPSGPAGDPPEAMKLAVGLSTDSLFGIEKAVKPQPVAVVASEETSAAEKLPAVAPQTQYGAQTAALLTGSDLPGTDTIVTTRAPLQSQGKNEAMRCEASELYSLSKLRGIEPPRGMRYLAVNLSLTNTFTDRPYVIPNITQHFYLSVNNKGDYPASTTTWLAEKPLTIPGDTTIEIPRGEMVEGMLLFVVPEEAPQDLCLSFYDTSFGHIDLTLMGSPQQKPLPLTELPKSTPAKLSDAFTLSIDSYADVLRIGQQAAPAGVTYRIVEGTLLSNVQALLNIKPQERFFMNVETASGVFRLPISPLTNALPFGYLAPKLLAPGTATTIRWVFELPSVLVDSPSEIYGDISGGAIHIPVKTGTPLMAAKGTTYPGEYLDITINETGILNSDDFNKVINWFSNTTAEKVADEQVKVAAGEAKPATPLLSEVEGTYFDDSNTRSFYFMVDATFQDKADGYGTGNIASALAMISNRLVTDAQGKVFIDGNPAEGGIPRDIMTRPANSTSSLILGVGSDFTLMDGEQRRGLLIFELGADHKLTLRSEHVSTMQVALPNTRFSNPYLLSPLMKESSSDDSFATAVAKEIEKVVAYYRATQPKPQPVSAAAKTSSVFVIAASPGKDEIPAPSTSLYGSEQLKRERSSAEILALLRSLAWRPGDLSHRAWQRFAPEAVLTQGWGSEVDLLVLAEQLFARAGIRVERTRANLTDLGRSALAEYLKITPDPEVTEPPLSALQSLPLLSYQDEYAKSHMLVIPFMCELTELEGYVYLPYNRSAINIEDPQVKITIQVEAVALSDEAKGVSGGAGGLDVGGLFGSMLGSTAGEEKPKSGEETVKLTVLEQTLPLKELSLDAVDVGFALADEKVWTPWLETPQGRKAGRMSVDPEHYLPKSVTYQVSISNKDYLHEVKLEEGQSIDGVFCTLAIGLPEFGEEALDALDSYILAGQEFKNPDEISSLRWYTRNRIYRFIGQQTAVEDEIAEKLGLSIGRATRPRVMAVSLQRTGDGVTAKMNLLDVFNEIHNGTALQMQSFNIVSGMTLSELEGRVFDSDGLSYADIWRQAPEKSHLFMVTTDTISHNVPIMRKAGLPEAFMKRMEWSRSQRGGFMYLLTDLPTVIDGQEHWAMLEYSAETGETIAVLDDGTFGGFAEYLILNHLNGPSAEDYLGFTVGAMVGVETGVWAFSAAMIKTGDYETALPLAMAYAGYVNTAVQAFFGLHSGAVGTAGIFGGQPSIGLPGGSLGSDIGGTSVSELLESLKYTPEIGGPAEGFSKGLAAYFGIK